MKIDINESPVDIRKVTYRQLGYGEAVKEKTTFFLNLTIQVSLLRDHLKETVDHFISDCQKDDIKYGGLEIDSLVEINYPGFDDLEKNHPNILALIIREYLFFEFLESLFSDNDHNECKYCINSIKSFEIKVPIINVKCEAYSI